ncbi:MAG: c-type cytochrome [Aliarcobacter sp.]|jgi:cytochrome c553|nr:c-type cytochrome [Aliarcobacter sp.]
MNRILLGSAVTVFLLAGCGDEKKTTAEVTAKVATEQTTTKEVVTEATKDVAQTVTKAATEVTNTVTEATNKVVENTSEAVKETTANVMETAKEVVSASDTTVKEAANTAVTETAAKVEEVKESTKEIAVAVVEETKEALATTVAQGETAVANATESVAPIAEGLDGEALFKSCASCHGQKAEKEALGKSQVIAGWDKEKTIQALNGYKAGTYGGVMKNIMKGQVATKTDAEIDALATFISKL